MIISEYLSDLEIIISPSPGTSLDGKCESLSKDINTALDNHAPFQEMKIGTYRKPWFN